MAAEEEESPQRGVPTERSSEVENAACKTPRSADSKIRKGEVRVGEGEKERFIGQGLGTSTKWDAFSFLNYLFS
jgi:hypothetical protein